MFPATVIYLANTPLENDYKNTLNFSNKEVQLNYFLSKMTKEYHDFNYQRKDNAIIVDDNIENIRLNNYVFYQNTNFSNKWFYAFITSMEYVSDDVTRIFIETDVFQTWQFDINYKQTFIEREHVNNDTAGLHTVPEGLETGEYIINNHIKDENLTDTRIIIGSTVNPFDLSSSVGGIYNGIYSGIKYYSGITSKITESLQKLTDDTKADAVTSLFLAPKFISMTENETPTVRPADIDKVKESDTVSAYYQWIDKQTSLNGYTPKNKKLLTYPYIYLLVSNACGGNAIYHEELFSTNRIQFDVRGSLTPGCSIKTFPVAYRGDVNNYDDSLTAGKFPQLNWATDQFTNWVTQNGVNVATNITENLLSTGTNVASGNALNGVSGLFNIANSVRQVQLAEKIPPQTRGNLNSGDVATSDDDNTFHYYSMSIKSEYAQIIDDYFSMFGYKINRVKQPNITGRRNWNYVKTINCNFTGDIPQDDMRIIKQIFDNGITIWHNPNTMFDYSQNNDII